MTQSDALFRGCTKAIHMPAQQFVCCKFGSSVSAVERLAMVVYKHVFEDGIAKGNFQWKLHRCSAGGFPSAYAAAKDLAVKLRIKIVFLKLGAQVSTPSKPQLPAHLVSFPLVWSSEKLGWYSRSSRTYHIDPAEAVKKGKLAKKLVRPKVDSRPGPLRRFVGVTYHAGNKAWVAQTRGSNGVWRQIGGLHMSEAKAAQTRANHMGVSMQSIQKQKQWYQRPKEVLDHFRGVMSAYSQVSFPARLPGDLCDLINNARLSGDSRLTTSPQNIALWTLFKYSPYRAELRRAWRRQKNGGDIKGLLKDVIQRCAGIPAAKLAAWRANCGRNVSHHHGFLPTLQSLKVLKKVKTSKKKKTHAIGKDFHCIVKPKHACLF